MKYLPYVILAFVLVGCTGGGAKIGKLIEEPEYLIKDQQFEDVQAQLDALESKYLQKKITYAEYLEQKSELTNDYDRKVKSREDRLHASPSDPIHSVTP